MRGLGIDNLKQLVQDEAGLAVDYGTWFSQAYAGFIRLNLATTPAIIAAALDQLIRSINIYKQQTLEEDTHDN